MMSEVVDGRVASRSRTKSGGARGAGVLGFVTPMRTHVHDGRIYTHVASGRILDRLAERYDLVLLCARVLHEAPRSTADLALEASNVELRPQAYWPNTLGSLRHLPSIARAYYRTCRDANVIFVRGMCPYIAVLYFWAYVFGRRVCHWIVGDPVALLQAGARDGTLKSALSLLYARQDRLATRVGRWLTAGALICNGEALAASHASPRTFATVSSTVTADEFFERDDTCTGPVVRILFVGFLRQEKGLEYLLQALSRLRMSRPWTLEVVGPYESDAYHRRLDEIMNAEHLHDRVTFRGYVPYGPPLHERLRAADMLVLPSLSEGTPHVLVEAKANGLPCISTTVGGIPSTVTDGVDAVLVPPRDAAALAGAIDRVIADGAFRRSLIQHGYESAHRQTLDAFVALVARELDIDPVLREA